MAQYDGLPLTGGQAAQRGQDLAVSLADEGALFRRDDAVRVRGQEQGAVATGAAAVRRPAAVEDAGPQVAEGLVPVLQRRPFPVYAGERVLDDVLGGRLPSMTLASLTNPSA
jgi:hypothetical protein